MSKYLSVKYLLISKKSRTLPWAIQKIDFWGGSIWRGPKDKVDREWDGGVQKTKLMVSGMEKKAFNCKIDPCGTCGTRVMSNSVLCRACGKWVHARCTEKKKVSVYVSKNFVFKKCRSVVNNFKGSADEKVCDGVETVSKFTYLGDRLNATGGCETAVTARSRIDWMKFRECSEILKGRRFSLKMKGKIYKSCVRSGMLYGSEAWCLREKEMTILRRTERAMIQVMCGVKLLDRRNSDELMDM